MANRNIKLYVTLALVLVTALVYARTLGHGFINFDDMVLVRDNYNLRGLDFKHIKWAFTKAFEGNYHPITWLTFMLDHELWGAWPGGYHITNLLLHLATTATIFLLFCRMTGKLWQSAFVAAIFALHPLHIESVAWVSERKDVLSALFMVLTIWAYVRYTERKTTTRYTCVMVFFILGLLSKSMLVTLPFVLLLLDVWPLGRIDFEKNIYARHIWMPVIEKIPLFVLSAVASAVTFLAQQSAGAVAGTQQITLAPRLANAVNSYAAYIGKTVYPTGLSFFYPHSGSSVALWNVAGAGFFLILITVIVLSKIQKRPYLFTGWFWYLGTLVPVIGIVQVGSQGMADRYMYIPMTGLSIIAAWGAADLLLSGKETGYAWKIRALSAAGLTVIIMLGAATYHQLAYWKTSETLFTRALEVSENNYMAHHRLSLALAEKGDLNQAVTHNLLALMIKPGQKGVYDVLKFQLAELEFYPGEAEVAAKMHYRVAELLKKNSKVPSAYEKALYHYSEAARIKPDFFRAHMNAGTLYGKKGMYYEAVDSYTKASKLSPKNPLPWFNLALAYELMAEYEKAAINYRRAIELKPDYKKAIDRLNAINIVINNLKKKNQATTNAAAGTTKKQTKGK